MFAQTGFSETFHDAIQGDPTNSDWTKDVYGMLVGDAVLFLIGSAVQVFVTGKDREYEEEDNGYQKL